MSTVVHYNAIFVKNIVFKVGQNNLTKGKENLKQQLLYKNWC